MFRVNIDPLNILYESEMGYRPISWNRIIQFLYKLIELKDFLYCKITCAISDCHQCCLWTLKWQSSGNPVEWQMTIWYNAKYWYNCWNSFKYDCILKFSVCHSRLYMFWFFIFCTYFCCSFGPLADLKPNDTRTKDQKDKKESAQIWKKKKEKKNQCN